MALPFLFDCKIVCHVQSSPDSFPQHFLQRAHALQLNLQIYQPEISHKVQPVTMANKEFEELAEPYGYYPVIHETRRDSNS